MRLVDQFRGVRHTFESNRGRTFLTLVGIMIGAGSIVLLASLLSGGQEALLNADQGAADTDIVQVDADEAPAKEAERTRRELGRYDSQFLDDAPTVDGVEAQLRALERRAQSQGVAIAIGHPHEVTLDAIAYWAAHEDGFSLVDLRTAIRLKTERAAMSALASARR